MKKMIIYSICFLMICILPSAGCKKKAVEDRVFNEFISIDNDKVQIFEDASTTSKALKNVQKGINLDIIELKKKGKETWYKVKDGETTGYILQSGYGINAYLSVKPEEAGFITVGDITVSEELFSKSTFIAKPGEFFKILFQYDDGTFLFVKMDNGKTGFLNWSNTYTKGPAADIEELKKAAFEPINAWVEIISAKPVFLNIPGKKGRAVTREDKAECGQDISKYPKKNEYAVVKDKVTIDGVVYYHIWQAFYEPQECSAINGWVSGTDAVLVTDFYKHTIEKSKTKLDRNILGFINTTIGGNLNVLSLKLTKVNLGNIMPGAEFYQVSCESGDNGQKTHLVISKKNSNFSILYSLQDDLQDGSYGGNLIARDIDGDGNFELTENISVSCDMCQDIRVYCFKNGKYENILGFYNQSSECTAFSDDYRYLVYYNKKKYEDSEECEKKFDSHPFKKQYDGKEIRVLEFKKGEYSEVDSETTGLDYTKLRGTE